MRKPSTSREFCSWPSWISKHVEFGYCVRAQWKTSEPVGGILGQGEGPGTERTSGVFALSKRSKKRRKKRRSKQPRTHLSPGGKTVVGWVLLLVFGLTAWWVVRLYRGE